MIDLHTHSNASDGSMSPRELAIHAKNSGLSLFALTDHDTVDGISQARNAARECSVGFVPGIELSVCAKKEMHIVGLGIDPDCPELQEALHEILRVRDLRARKTAQKLQKLGFDVTYEMASAKSPSGKIGRAHFAKVLLDLGYVASVDEAFLKYLGSNCPAYCSEQAITPEEAIALIRAAGGIPVAAHLHLMGLDDDELYATLFRLHGVGLAAVEGYYSDYTPQMELKYCAMARRIGLGISGGSDFHGSNKPHIAIGKGRGNLCIPDSVWDDLRALR